MKYRLFTLLALSGVLFSSCVKENFQAEGGSILAVMENDDTRTSVTDEGVFTWSEGDKVWLHTTSEGVVGTLSSGAGTASANFSYGSYFGEMTDRAVYPYNEGHSISGDVLSVVMPSSYDLGSALTNTNAAMYGLLSDGRLRFNHMAGVMRFKFNNVPAGVNKFTITLDKKISGTFTADLTEAFPVIESEETSVASEKTITLNFNALTETSDIALYIPLPLGTYNSLDLALYSGAKSVWTYSKSVTNTIARKSLKLMPAVTLGGTIGGDIEGGESEEELEPEPQSGDYVDEYGINHGQGIKIGGTVWAPVNCGYHATDYKYGKLYQWGRKYGQGYSGGLQDGYGNYLGEYSDASVPEILAGPVSLDESQSESNAKKFYYNSSYPRDWLTPQDDNLWNSGTEYNPVKTEYDPCPEGWRVPTYSELSELKSNHSFWTTDENGQIGYWFSGTEPYSESVPRVFFPAAGGRTYDDGDACLRGNCGVYWSSSAYSNEACRLGFLRVGVSSLDNIYHAYGHSVRCLQEQSISVDQPVESESVNLSAEGTANSYIVSGTGAYKFTPTKGNSNESVGAIASATILWETFGTSTSPKCFDLIKACCYKDGCIAFQTADTFKEGNAVIAAKDASGKILWSWHIWLTDQPQGQVYYNNAGTMMDRNLGATSATPGDVGALGLLYQWGRKDPFLGGSSISYVSSSNQTIAESTITWPSSVSSDSSNGTIAYATANPTTFIANNGSNYDWYYTGNSSTDNTRWITSGNEKSVYDPCPSGWRVPDGGSSGVWSKALGSSSSFSDELLYDSTNEGINFSGKFGSDQTIWYPASGYRTNIDGSLGNVGYGGGYWSASPTSYGAFFLSFSSSGDVYPSNYYYYRALGYSVRCLQESK